MGTQAIGAALAPDILAGVTIGTDSPECSSAKVLGLVTRLDDRALAKAEQLANSPLPDLPRCDDGEFTDLLLALTILPRRADDQITAELRYAIYRRKLIGYPHDALKFMVSTVLDELSWYPTIAQCLDILGRWRRSDGEGQRRASAASMARAERQARFDEVMRALERREIDQDGIDALPISICVVGAERGFLRLHDDGAYRARALPTVSEDDPT